MIATSTSSISAQTLLPDLLAQRPAARAVLDRYGLRGCGGPNGPHETVRFFARAHGVDLAELLREINDADAPAAIDDTTTAETAAATTTAAAPAAAPPAPALPGVEDSLYRRYFTAAILAILTAGATWGAYLLWKIGFAGDFTGVSIHEVNAHGHAQIFGWVGLFIMGFAYQAFPRMWHTRLAAPPLAVVAFLAMLAGIVLRTIGMAAAGAPGSAGGWALPAAMLGGALQIASVAIFVAQIPTTFLRSNARLEPYVGFILMGLFWFLAQALMCVWHTWNTMTAGSRDELLWYVATYQAPLRDLQIHGLALFMILGVCIRMLPALFGLPQLSDRRAWAALAILTFAVVQEVAVFVLYRWTGNHALAALLLIPWLMLTLGVAMVALPWKLWRPVPENDGRSAKFVRAAYAWLAVSLLMLLLLPVYQLVSGIAFSHAYYGAIRHAITVGFISLMIMGFAAKLVPTLNGVDPRKLGKLWGPFLLINLGCFLRVSTQTLTDFHPGFFAVVGVSGTLEVAALAWWGVGLIRVMRDGKRQTAALDPPARSAPPQRIDAGHIVADVLAWFPQTEAVFLAYGFTPLFNRITRATLARTVTLAQAARARGVPLDALLNDLNLVAGPTDDRCAPAACAHCTGCAH